MSGFGFGFVGGDAGGSRPVRQPRLPVRIRVSLHFPELQGNRDFEAACTFYGSEEAFEAEWERMKERIIREMRVPMRPCGYPGPWWRG